MDTRSTTGCGTCKARRKKCDETHPKCKACTRLGLDCSGYQYIESTPGKGKRPRTKPDPLQPPTGRRAAFSTPSRREPVLNNPSGLGSLLDTSASDSRTGMKTTCTSLDPGSFPTHPLLPESGSSSGRSLDIWLPSGGNWRFSSQSCSGLVQSGCDNVTQDLGETHFFSHQSLGSQGGLDSTIDTHTTTLHSGTFWKRRNEISSNCAWLPSSHSTPQLEWTLDSSCYLEGSFSGEAGEGEEGDDNDAEVLEQMLYISPIMDSSVEDNFIPFVLQNYAQWCLLVVFEPLELSLLMKQYITREIASSESRRAWMMLLAGALRPLLKNPRPNQDCKFAVSTMRAGIDQKAARYTSEHVYLEPTFGKQQALKLLAGYLEIIFIQAPTFPLRFLYQLVQDAAPIFRCACPDPAGLPVYLPSRLINPPFSLQYFIALDVATSVTSGRPMLCDYDPGFSLELCDQLFERPHNYNFQWLFGAPGQYILLLARINTLYAHQGVDVAPHFLAQIEQSLSEIRIPLVGSTDPALRVGRMIVQEGWRQAVYIYLYMTLYGANAKDQRVEQARRTFMRLVNETKPGRNPDAFLVIPLMIIGIVSLKQRHRDAIRLRILGLRECRNPESAWNDNIRIMEDVWVRTAAEGRPAIWLDLRIAFHKVTGL